MKKIILITLIFITNNIFSQNKFLDFIVTHNNDTIFGRYRTSKLIDINKKSHKINRKKIKTIGIQDKVYNLVLLKNKEFFSDENDSLLGIIEYTKSLINKESYFFVRKLGENEKKDFIILKDTIFGRINTSILGFDKLITDSNEKYSTNLGTFRKKGSLYFHKEGLRIKGNIASFNIVELIYNGEKARLYKQEIKTQSYSQNYSQINYYIERNGKLEYILPNRFSKIIERIMPENKKLIKKIKKREYTYFDIYLVVKYFNESQLI